MIIPHHWHFQILAYKAFDKITNQMHGTVTIDILDCDTEEEAIERAKGKIKRNGYYLSRAWQCNSCLVNLRQGETAASMAKSFKKHLEE